MTAMRRTEDQGFKTKGELSKADEESRHSDTAAIPALQRRRQGDQGFKVILAYLVSSRSAWANKGPGSNRNGSIKGCTEAMTWHFNLL